MKRFKSIVLVSCKELPDETVLERAVSLAQGDEAALTVVEVVDSLPSDTRQVLAIMGPLLLEDPEKSFVQEQYDQLLHAVESVRKQAIPGEVKVLVGNPSREVPREVRRGGYDLVVFAAVRRHGWRQWLFGGATTPGLLRGSTADKTLRKIGCSVLILQPNGLLH